MSTVAPHHQSRPRIHAPFAWEGADHERLLDEIDQRRFLGEVEVDEFGDDLDEIDPDTCPECGDNPHSPWCVRMPHQAFATRA